MRQATEASRQAQLGFLVLVADGKLLLRVD